MDVALRKGVEHQSDDHQLDLCGLLCPLTWARTRQALSTLAEGDLLRVIVDHRPAVPDINRNAEELGHEVVSSREAANGAWEIRIRLGHA